jgi:Arc/MetJ family transcription regulator
MGFAKVSLSLEDALVTAARKQAGPGGLSSYVNEALRRELQRNRIVAFLEEMERERGPIDPRVMKEVRAEWPAKGKRRRRSSA